MRRESLTAVIRNSHHGRRVLLIGALLLLTLAMSLLMGFLRLPGWQTAPWWPALGPSVIAALSARNRQWLVVLAVFGLTAFANGVTGTVWWIALLFGCANALEVWIIATVMRRQPLSRWSSRSSELIRFTIAAFIGGAAGGAITAATLSLVGQDFLSVFGAVTASHITAVIMIGSFGVLPLESLRVRRIGELTAQLALLMAVLALAFWPGQGLPITFLLFPVLAWASLRFGIGIVLTEVALVSLIAVILGVFGGGSFAAASQHSPGLFVGLNQLFTLSLAISMLLLATLQDDRNALLHHLSAREKLLQGSLVSASGGFLLLERTPEHRFSVLEQNPTFGRLLPGWSVSVFADGSHELAAELAELPGVGQADAEGWNGTIKWKDRQLEMWVAPLDDEHSTLLVQALDVTEEEQAKQAMELALEHERKLTEEMRQLSLQKDEFVSSVSHELRTPVTSILGYAEELELSDLSEEDQQLLEVVTRNARRLASLIEDLLTLSRMNTLDQYSPVPVDISNSVRESVSDLSRAASKKNVTLQTVMPEQLFVPADPLWLHRVITNLASNAVKFSGPGDSVTIVVEKDSTHAIIRITDTGPGISKEDLNRVFERFYRVVDEDMEYTSGTGLGLPIVRQLMERMGGTVTLESDGKGGTEATIRLPKLPGPHTAAIAIQKATALP